MKPHLESVRASVPGVSLLSGALLLLAFVLSGVGCATTASTPTVQRLTAKSYPPTQTVDVLTSAPAGDYVRIAQLHVSDPTGTATRDQLVAQLSSSAKSLGANAIVIGKVEKAQGDGVAFNPSGGQMQQQTDSDQVSSVSALAIRYTHP